MAVKTFGSEILTSGDVNTYLANSGLVYVKSQTVGSGVSSVQVTGAFSSDYDAYKIVYTSGVASTSNTLGLRLGSTTTGYNGWVVYGTSTSNTVNGLALNNGNGFTYAGAGTGSNTFLAVELIGPYQPKNTMFSNTSPIGTVYGNMAAMLSNTTSYTDFTIYTDAGTITGGTIIVYGYRKP